MAILKILTLILGILGAPLAYGVNDPSPPSREYTFPILQEESNPIDQNVDKFLSEFLSMLATLGLFIAIILIAAWFLKRILNAKIQQANDTSQIKILERRTLSPKSSIYLLEVRSKGWIVGESHNGIVKIGELDLSEKQ